MPFNFHFCSLLCKEPRKKVRRKKEKMKKKILRAIHKMHQNTQN